MGLPNVQTAEDADRSIPYSVCAGSREVARQKSPDQFRRFLWMSPGKLPNRRLD